MKRNIEQVLQNPLQSVDYVCILSHIAFYICDTSELTSRELVLRYVENAVRGTLEIPFTLSVKENSVFENNIRNERRNY